MIIVLSILYFQNHVTYWNGFGIFLALFGFGMYNHIHKMNNRNKLAKRLAQKYQYSKISERDESFSHDSASTTVNVRIVEDEKSARIDTHTVSTQPSNLIARDVHHTHRQTDIAK